MRMHTDAQKTPGMQKWPTNTETEAELGTKTNVHRL